MGHKLKKMERSKFNELSITEIFTYLNKKQAEIQALKSELLAAKQKIATYQDAIGTEEEAQLAKQAAILEGQAQTITLEDLCADMPADIDADGFAPDADAVL